MNRSIVAMLVNVNYTALGQYYTGDMFVITRFRYVAIYKAMCVCMYVHELTCLIVCCICQNIHAFTQNYIIHTEYTCYVCAVNVIHS